MKVYFVTFCKQMITHSSNSTSVSRNLGDSLDATGFSGCNLCHRQYFNGPFPCNLFIYGSTLFIIIISVKISRTRDMRIVTVQLTLHKYIKNKQKLFRTNSDS